MEPCKHLDYQEENYPGCTLLELPSAAKIKVKYWRRNTVPYEGAPQNVQFCKRRGRINSILDCYTPGEMSCYEPVNHNKDMSIIDKT